jgi:hypothetical protein
MRGQGVRKDARNGQRPAAPGGWAKPTPWDAGGSPRFIHTNNSPNPILALLSGRFEARVYASERVAGQLKRLPDHGLAPCNMGCVVCDLITRGGGIPGQEGGNGFTRS